MQLLFLGLGAVLGGLFLAIKDLFPYLAAKRSGVIDRKGARAVRVRRDEDPEGFARLLANRGRSMGLGLGLSLAGAVLIGLFVLAAYGSSGPLAMVVMAAYAAFVLFAAWCLIRGLTTGRMFAIWSFALFGEATLKQNAIWFWLYGLINLAIVVMGVLTFLPLVL
jgi:hypothetical protein